MITLSKTAAAKAVAYLDQREAERIQVDREAVGIVRQSDSSMDCHVSDYSDTGACLEFKRPENVPDQFKVFIPETGTLHDCALVWKEENRVGVRFRNSVTL